MRSVYIIIPTFGIGGAEKRFIELFCYLSRNDQSFNYHLIISEELQYAVKDNPEILKILQPHAHRILKYQINRTGSVKRFQSDLYHFICLHASENDILHFILSFPSFIYPLKFKHTIYSLTESSLSNVNYKGQAIYLLNALRARYVDILDPFVHKKIRNYYFFRKKKIQLTPGSFVDTTVFKPAAPELKENWFVFLGRFFFVKQVVRLLKTLPDVCKKLEDAGFSDYKFIFLGYGQEEPQMRKLMELPEYQNLPIEIKMTNNPDIILAKSKLFFSLQLRNNYPSKSLLEAMSAGNIPIVTDVGSTRLVASPDCAYYVPENFTANEISEQLIAVLSLDKEALQKKMNTARNMILNNFTIKASASYYTAMYKKMEN